MPLNDRLPSGTPLGQWHPICAGFTSSLTLNHASDEIEGGPPWCALRFGGNGANMIEAGDTKHGKGLVIGLMSELSRELSMTRSSLAFYAASATPNVPAFMKKMARKNAIGTIKHLGNVF